jgi:Na+/melibiose symporter-like transporter
LTEEDIIGRCPLPPTPPKISNAPRIRSSTSNEHDSGERKEGTYFAVWAFASKTAAGGAGVLVGFALDAAGYVPNAPPSASAAATIRFLYAGVPLVLWSAGILISRRFKLTSA